MACEHPRKVSAVLSARCPDCGEPVTLAIVTEEELRSLQASRAIPGPVVSPGMAIGEDRYDSGLPPSRRGRVP